MIYLSELGHNVVGVELSESAVVQFFNENKLSPQIETQADFNIYQTDRITIYQGDLFDLKKHHLEGVKAVYDRASLIALPNKMDQRYVEHIRALLPLGWNWLLVTLDFGDSERNIGPPFSTDPARVASLFAEYASITLLHEDNIFDDEPRFHSKGRTFLHERAYLLQS